MNNNKIKKYDRIRSLYQQKYLKESAAQNNYLINLIRFKLKDDSRHVLQQQTMLHEEQRSQRERNCLTEEYPIQYQSRNLSKDKANSHRFLQFKYEEIANQNKRPLSFSNKPRRKQESSLGKSSLKGQLHQKTKSLHDKNKNNPFMLNLLKYASNKDTKKNSIINLIHQLKSNRQKEVIFAQGFNSSKIITQVENKKEEFNKNDLDIKMEKEAMKRLVFSQRQKRPSLIKKQRSYKLSLQGTRKNKSKQVLNVSYSRNYIEPWIVYENEQQKREY